MYNPPLFRQTDDQALLTLIQDYPLATLITVSKDEPMAHHLPMFFQGSPAENHDDEVGMGRLLGHIAKANPLWTQCHDGQAALAVFQGPDSYISPSLYPSKQEHGKVVPTWNYTVVQVAGMLRFTRDTGRLRWIVTELTRKQETRFARLWGTQPWQVSDAPEEFVAEMLGRIVGVELEIQRVEGKWKMSQNRPAPDREAVAERLGLSQDPGERRVAGEVGKQRNGK